MEGRAIASGVDSAMISEQLIAVKLHTCIYMHAYIHVHTRSCVYVRTFTNAYAYKHASTQMHLIGIELPKNQRHK